MTIIFNKTTVKAYEPAKTLPDINGMPYREAFIAVAKSQIGYKEDKNGETVYGAWAGDSKQAWCSEFVAWCAEQAGIPETIIPKKRSAIGYRSFFKDKNSFYLLKNGGFTSSCGCQEAAMGILSLDNLEKGDILLMDNHTCIFLYMNGNKIHTLDGNSGDEVCERDKDVSRIHGVCKPNFEQTDTLFISENNGTKYVTDRYGNPIHVFFSYHENSYYAQEDGSLACNEFIKNGWYYASADCCIQTGEFTAAGKKYIANETGRLYKKSGKFKYNGNYYYATEDGSLAKNELVSGSWYATNDYTLLAKDSIIIEDKKYFFNKNAELEGIYNISKDKSIVKYNIDADDEYNVFNLKNIKIPKKILVKKGAVLKICNASIYLIAYNGCKYVKNKIKVNKNTKLKILIKMNGKMKTYKVKLKVKK